MLNHYSDETIGTLVNMMISFLETHKVYELMQLVVSAIATKEDRDV